MSPEERQLLNELFARVGQASSTPRDAEAEALIRDEVARHPYAAYYLAQAVILQEKGLEASAARIGQLEAQVKELQQGATAQGQQGQGGFLSGLSSLFGGNAQGQGAQAQQPAGPWGRSGPQAPAYDGGYTRGAPQPDYEARKKEADAMRERVQSCEEATSYFRSMRNTAVREIVVKTSADLPQALRELLDKTPVGHLTPPEFTKQGVEMVALCGRKATTVDTPKKREIRDKMFRAKYDAKSKAYLQEVRKAAMIEYRH